MIALMYFLHNPQVEVKAITVTSGEAYPREFALLLERMLLKLDQTDIPIGAGSETPLAGNNAFPDPWRVATSEFWGIELPEIPGQTEPLDATNQVVWTRQDADSWQISNAPEGIMASQFLDWMLNAWFQDGVYVWDLVTAVNMTHPELCESKPLYVEITTEKGPNEGRTVVIEGKTPNLRACLHPESRCGSIPR